MGVKGNQKTLFNMAKRCNRLAPDDQQAYYEKRNGKARLLRVEVREVPEREKKMAFGGLLSHVVRLRMYENGSKTPKKIRYFMTTHLLSSEEAMSLIRGHWQIENRLHWVRDVCFQEDACQFHPGAAFLLTHLMNIMSQHYTMNQKNRDQFLNQFKKGYRLLNHSFRTK